MKSLGWILPFLVVSVQALAAGEVGNGGGVAQLDISYAYSHLDRFLDECIRSPRCGLSQDELSLVQHVRRSLPQEWNSKDQIVYLDGSKNPGFFVIDGKKVTARTGNEVGDKIYIDSENIYFPSHDGQLLPLSIPQAVGLLTHEMAHHQGAADSFMVLAVKLQSMAESQTQRVEYGFYFGEGVYLSVMNFPDLDGATQVLMADRNHLIDLSYLFAIGCEEKSFPGIPKGSLELKYSWFSNPHWVLPNSGSQGTTPPGAKIAFGGDIQYQCKFKGGAPGTVAGDFFFNVDLQFSQDFDRSLNDYIPGSATLNK